MNSVAIKRFKDHEVLSIGDESFYLERKAFTRRLKLYMKPNGTNYLVASRTAGHREIIEFLLQHQSWMEDRKIKQVRLREANPPKSYRAGEKYYFLGEPHALRYIKSDVVSPKVWVSSPYLICEIPATEWNESFLWAPQPKFRNSILEFYKEQGCDFLAKSTAHFSRLMQEGPVKLQFRAQTSRWGSCSSSGTISLNWKLILAPQAVVNYVVVHELAHIAHPNHSDRFWRRVAEFCPDYYPSRKWLRRNHYLFDFLQPYSELHSTEL